MRIEFDRVLEIAIAASQSSASKRSENKPSEVVPAAKILFPGLGILGCTSAEFFGFIVGKFEP